jgi:hypothetical protein
VNLLDRLRLRRRHRRTADVEPDREGRSPDAELRARLAARLRSGEGLDLDASLAAREQGWTRGRSA